MRIANAALKFSGLACCACPALYSRQLAYANMVVISASGAVPARLVVRAQLRHRNPNASRRASGLGPRPQSVPCRTWGAPNSSPVVSEPSCSTTAVHAFTNLLLSMSMKEYNETIEQGKDVTTVMPRPSLHPAL